METRDEPGDLHAGAERVERKKLNPVADARHGRGRKQDGGAERGEGVMTAAQMQAMFESVFTLVLTCYAIGSVGGLIVWVMKKA